MKNWKTTLGGILLGIGTPMASAGDGIYKTIGTILATIGGILVGVAARDATVTSKSMGLD
jgi:hypothetical protein